MAAADKAYELLKQRVIGGTYAPGAQLKEEHLARELEISRTPVRVALRRLAFSRGGLALSNRLDDLNEQMAHAITAGGSALPERLQQINSQFHRAILEASGSPRLKAMLEGLIDMPIVIRSHFISTLQDKVQSLQHHRDLAAAVRAGDGELARQVMQLHLRVAAHRFKRQRSAFSAGPPGDERAARQR